MLYSVKRKKFSLRVLVVLFVFLSAASYSQGGQADSVRIEITPYGSFRGHIAYYNGELQIQENASRIGFNISMNLGNVRLFVGTELAMNLFRSPIQFNADANTSSGFIEVEREQVNQVFATRLGYIGTDLGKFGILTFGKQWSVYYDITGTTDRFNVFGGTASATYVGGTDGGIGTGRASQAITYRNRIGRLSLGLQVSLINTLNNKFIDGYGIGCKYEIVRGLFAGGAYVRRYFAEEFFGPTLGLGDQPRYYTMGVSYVSELWDIGVVYANQTNGDLTEVLIDEELVGAIFDAQGAEVFIKFRKPKYSIIAGFNGYYPDIDDFPVSPKFGGEYYIIGAEFKPVPFAFVYAEYRLSERQDQFGLNEFDVFTLGLRIDLEHTFPIAIKR